MNFKNAINVSTADSVAGSDLFIMRSRAEIRQTLRKRSRPRMRARAFDQKIGPLRKEEIPNSSQDSSSKRCNALTAASCIKVNYCTTSRRTQITAESLARTCIFCGEEEAITRSEARTSETNTLN